MEIKNRKRVTRKRKRDFEPQSDCWSSDYDFAISDCFG